MLPPRRRSRFLPALLVATSLSATLLATERTAVAFVRNRTEAGFSPYYWRDPRQVLELAIPDAASGITPEEFRVAATAALKSWSHEAIPCTALELTVAPEMSFDVVAKFDGRNRIAMRTGLWCRDPAHPTEKTCHDENAVAVTIVFKRVRTGSPDDGRILDADIAVNAVGFPWKLLPDMPPSGNGAYDVASALTHEVGHFIGLDHTCSVSGPSPLIDDQGRPVPECGLEPSDQLAQITSSTMYPTMDVSDVDWRTLSDDERKAACTIYPLTSVPLDEWGGMGGCTTAAGSAPRRAGGVLLALAALVPLLLAAAIFRGRRRGHQRFR